MHIMDMRAIAHKVIDDATKIVKWRSAAMREKVLIPGAMLRRQLMPRMTMVGVTGSAGKTTTKELIRTVLAARWKGSASFITENRPDRICTECYGERQFGTGFLWSR